MGQSVTHSVTQSVTHSVSQSVTQSLTQSPTHPPTHPPTHTHTHSVTHSLSPSVTQSLSHSLTQSINCAFNCSLNQSGNQSVKQCWFVGLMNTPSQSVSQYATQLPQAADSPGFHNTWRIGCHWQAGAHKIIEEHKRQQHQDSDTGHGRHHFIIREYCSPRRLV